MLKGKKWIAFLTMFLFVAAITFLSRENGSAKRQQVWSNMMADSGYEDEAPYKGKIALTFDDDVIIWLSHEICYREAISVI